jgi:hypothetical protein
MPEASPEFKQQLRSAFDAREVGQIFTFRRTFTEGDVTLFAAFRGTITLITLTKRLYKVAGSDGALFRDCSRAA